MPVSCMIRSRAKRLTLSTIMVRGVAGDVLEHRREAWAHLDIAGAAHGLVVELGHDLGAGVFGEGLDGCPLAPWPQKRLLAFTRA